MRHALTQAAVIEAVATAVFACLFAALVGPDPTPPRALLGGLAFFTTSAAAAAQTGGHLNSAVTASLMATRHAACGAGFAYVGAQLVGALVGALLTLLTFSPHPRLAASHRHGGGGGGGGGDHHHTPLGPLCLAPLGSARSGWAAAAWEAGGTALVVYTAFCFGVVSTAKQRRGVSTPSSPLAAPAAIGAAVAVALAAAASAGGHASRTIHLNPALSIASAIFTCGPSRAAAAKAISAHVAAQLVGAGVAAVAAVFALGLWEGGEGGSTVAEVGVGCVAGEEGEEATAPLLGRAAPEV